jgi:GH15 family glucan-1,4-alpha-glucosidase
VARARAVGAGADEEIDLRDKALIGNFPQALSHIGMINAAWAISQAEDRSQPDQRD